MFSYENLPVSAHIQNITFCQDSHGSTLATSFPCSKESLKSTCTVQRVLTQLVECCTLVSRTRRVDKPHSCGGSRKRPSEIYSTFVYVRIRPQTHTRDIDE